MRVRFSRRAIDDLEDIFTYIAKDNSHAAATVIARIERLAATLGSSPNIGRPTDMQGVRMLSIVRYPYLVFYEILADEVVIRHVRHGARKPWSGAFKR